MYVALLTVLCATFRYQDFFVPKKKLPQSKQKRVDKSDDSEMEDVTVDDSDDSEMEEEDDDSDNSELKDDNEKQVAEIFSFCEIWHVLSLLLVMCLAYFSFCRKREICLLTRRSVKKYKPK